MRVLVFDPYPHVMGGAQLASISLATELCRRGVHLSFATPGPGPFVHRLRDLGFDHETFPLPTALMVYGGQSEKMVAAASLPAVWWQLARRLRGRFDIVHTIDHRGQILVAPAARLARIPVVWHVHAVQPGAAVNRICSALATATIVPSRAIAPLMPGGHLDEATEVMNAVPERVLDWPLVRPSAGPPVLVSVGRLHPDKGYDVLLEAVALLRGRHPALRACIVAKPQPGVEAYADDLARHRTRLGLDEVVAIDSGVDDVYAALARAAVYVQPSRPATELQPIAVLEAMAAGVPVVAARVGAVGAMLGEGTRGALVDPDDPAALAEGIEATLADRAGAERKAERARAFVHAHCSPATMADRVEAVYRRVAR